MTDDRVLVDVRREHVFNVYSRDGPAGGLRRQQRRSRKRWSEVLREVFLPEGYPASVSADYARYQVFDSVQAFCSSLTGLLAHRAILQGVGVGNELATAGSAVLQWAIRDGTGMLSRIGFAWATGSDLDVNAKTWRYAADVLNDAAMTLEMLTVHMPGHYFLPSVCAASVLRALVGVAGGATRASVTEHQALRGNTADVSAKDGSQETAVALLGMLAGMALAPLESLPVIWLLFGLATVVHLLANYMAVSALVLTTLNPQRLHILVAHRRQHGDWLSPEQVAARERVFTKLTLFGSVFAPVRFGVPVHDLLLTADQIDRVAASPTLPLFLHAKLRSGRGDGVALARCVDSAQQQIAIYLQAYAGVTAEEADKYVRQLHHNGWDIHQHKLGLSEWRYDDMQHIVKQASKEN